MKICFQIHYKTFRGQRLRVCGSVNETGNWNVDKSFQLHYQPGDLWIGTLELSNVPELLEYKYVLQDDAGHQIWEWGNNRKIRASEYRPPVMHLLENWRAPSNSEKVMYSSAFTDVIMKPARMVEPRPSRAKKVLQFSIQVPRIGRGYRACVLGNQSQLGNWDKNKPLLLSCGNDFPEWTGSINLAGLRMPLQYKYGIYHEASKEVVTIEEGPDRQRSELPGLEEGLLRLSDESFRYPLGNWKGAGVSVPVFSLRSDRGFGVGDFTDLMAFIDWAKSAGMKMVQILPVNETIASHNWLDSYPYKSISVMALHPIYLDIHKMGRLKDEKEMAAFDAARKRLNAENHVVYPEVLKLKSRYFKLLFDEQKDTFFNDTDYLSFFERNRSWLVPYAAFVFLRDRMNSPDFREWKALSTYDKGVIEKMSSVDSPEWDDIAVHYFIQYHLDKQLREVTAHARMQGIVLKGDIPIGISPNSVEAWTEPHLFHLEAQAGAPPDDFAVKGQNWGFPTYNWESMSDEHFSWWKNRLRKMADYFDAYRIDHILGFFRIWEIPIHAVEGVLGYFSPALPMSAAEIRQFGVDFDYERMVKPYIRHHFLHNIFGEYTEEVIETFLEGTVWGAYRMREDYNTQLKINRHFLNGIEEEELSDKDRWIRNGLFDLVSNVLFIETGHDQWHPRIAFHMTSSYAEMDHESRANLDRIYTHYFYQRHDEFWYHKGMEKLPAIITASRMLVCGEDLGMVPDCVPPVMDQLNILSLEIQRMSKNPRVRFAHPANAPYLSVCTTSTHDMPTIRGWWENNRDSIQLFYNNELGNFGEAPFYAEPWICRQIINQHMHSPAMWTTFPIQDLIAMDGKLRWSETQEEQINHPSNVRHKWRYRMQQSIEELKSADGFNELLRNLISESGRDSDY